MQYLVVKQLPAVAVVSANCTSQCVKGMFTLQ